MRKLKITGGEPLMRRDIVDIARKCSDAMNEISFTTNGTLLRNAASDLKPAGIRRVNVSLDTLDPSF